MRVSFGVGFRRDERGTTALIFGLMLVPIIGVIALAIDFGNVMTMRTKAQMAADAAALQASGIARDLIKSSNGSAYAIQSAIDDARTRATNLFNAHARQMGLAAYDIDVVVTKTGQEITSKATFDLTSDNYLSSYFGADHFKAVGSATASASPPTYVDVYVLMDTSQSMGLAATTADMQKLFDLTRAQTPEGCTFGCHVKKSGYPAGTLSNETIAHANGVRLRVDVMRDAVVNMIADAQSNAKGDSIYRFGLYSMGLNAAMSNYALNEIAPISGDLNALKSAATNIGLSDHNMGDGIGDSHINEQLRDFANKGLKSGDGGSEANAKVYLILVTDGLRDVANGCTTCHAVSVMNPNYCTPFKTTAADVTVGVIYTTYLPIYNNNNPAHGLQGDYAGLVAPIQAQIAPALQNCASQGWFFEASDEAAITSAFDKMFAQITSAPSLTN